MDLSIHETTASFNSDTDSSVVLSETSNDWVSRAVHLRRYPSKPQKRLPLTAPAWITNPTPAYRPQSTQRTNLSVLISRRWRAHWRDRNWDDVVEFFKTVEQDACPAHDIIRVGDPFL